MKIYNNILYTYDIFKSSWLMLHESINFLGIERKGNKVSFKLRCIDTDNLHKLSKAFDESFAIGNIKLYQENVNLLMGMVKREKN